MHDLNFEWLELDEHTCYWHVQYIIWKLSLGRF